MVRYFIWIILLFSLPALPVFGLQFANQGLGTKIELPDGYEDVTKAMAGKAMVALRKEDPATHAVKLIVLQDLGTTVGQHDLPQRRPGPNETMETAHWKKYSLLVCKISDPAGTTFNTQIPFKPHAIQLTIFGPGADEVSLRAQLQSIVDSADGPTNWMTADEINSSMRWALIRVGIGVAVVVGLGVFLMRRKNPGPSVDEIKAA